MSRISTVEQLSRSLAKGLPPITWISGDEPLLVLEAADSLRSRARASGFGERQVLEVGAHFDTSLLLEQTRSLSLFSERKLVDVRLAGKPTKDLGEALHKAAGLLGDDCRVLLTSARLERTTLNTAWFNALASAVLLLELPKVERDRLPEWLAGRLSSQGQRGSRQILALIADRTEGNLLAAHQELQRLALLLPPGDLDLAQVETIVLDSARYDIFGLIDTALLGQTARALRMVDALRAEDAALPLLTWGLADCLRRLLKVRQTLDGGQPIQSALRSAAVFGKRETCFRQAIGRLDGGGLLRLLRETAHLDRMAKGVGGLAGTGAPAAFGGSDPDSQWAAVERIVIGLCGMARLAA
ncbi:MAG: DNA polymerase III subunit delta [Lautropia sp.]|nr:DNA polymerase III subunit delta [Lautropia sp.]